MSGSIADNLRRIRERMAAAAERSGRDPGRITLVVVTKGVEADRIRQAVAAGATTLGENRVQEALPKIQAVGGSVRWHLIGHLQRNKVRLVVGSFEMIHSLDSLELAREINLHAERSGIRQKVLIQVKEAPELGKHGISLKDTEALARHITQLANLSLEGLMTLPPRPNDPEDSRPFFRSLAGMAAELRSGGLTLPELSMGMSDDFEVAVEEGATLIRVGTAIFGRRGT